VCEGSRARVGDLREQFGLVSAALSLTGCSIVGHIQPATGCQSVGSGHLVQGHCTQSRGREGGLKSLPTHAGMHASILGAISSACNYIAVVNKGREARFGQGNRMARSLVVKMGSTGTGYAPLQMLGR
jgi:hypothetical protein